ncbi:peptidylprolyl isomerase [Aerococcaceae bacterium WGS1372]
MKNTLKKVTLLALSSAMALSVATSTVTVLAQESDDEVIATVGDTQITKEELYQAMKSAAGNTTLRTIILETVLEQNVADPEALRTAAEEEVQTQIEESGGEEVFQQLLAYQGLNDIETYTYQIFVSKMFQEVVEAHMDMSDEAITEYYENEYTPKMEAQHILVETEEEALDVIERINNGEEFDAVAQEVSLDSTAQNGGLLEPFTSGQMVPEFEEAVKSLANGEMSTEPIESQYGFHVIKTINNGEKKPLEEIREEVEEQYVTTQFNDSQFAYGIIGKLIQDTGYEINDEELKDAVADLIELANTDTEAAEESSEETTEEETSKEELAEEQSTEEETTEESIEESAE